MSSTTHGGIKDRAQKGFADGANYDKYRPSYLPAATEELLSQCRVSGKSNAKILDLAAGSGKLTEVLARRPEEYEIVAVEPHDGMRKVLVDKHLPRTTVKAGRADAIPLPDESVDAVTVAQAFHWFSDETSLKEIHRVLRPHGVLGLVWNIEDYNAPREREATTPWEQKMQDLTWTFQDSEARFRHQKWKKVFEDQSKSTPLSLIWAKDQLFALPLGEHREPFEIWLGKEAVWERYATISHIAVLKGEERERTKQKVMDALNSSEVETNEKGEVAVHGLTYVVWTSKIPEDGRAGLTEVERPGA
ncbi:hypothetical protein LTR62_000645 [Meristemomyces frigidus]|uniref:Methyltransferase type 11 domain-containing protein n=1 Tax=Meristemomyces frigidus TaxID=1508187 RepID=A0AAN7T8Q7_9PEZI|nr:hypothetical protein LTR62_000645 [Meristemomyces frigidus]